MLVFEKKLVWSLVVMFVFTSVLSRAEIPKKFRNQGFVYLHEIDQTIQVSVRYSGNENFVGRPINGYKKPLIIIQAKAAEALKKVQAAVQKDGYCLVVYDAYRPQKAVDNFVAWSADIQDVSKKKDYYPRISKSDVFHLGYVAKRSGHSRGSAIDLTLIKSDQKLYPIKQRQRTLRDGSVITFLDDGTVDMGSSFDLFDGASHTENALIDERYKCMRRYLKQVMEMYGFKNYPKEWWHFTFKCEPFPVRQDSSYFNFDVA